MFKDHDYPAGDAAGDAAGVELTHAQIAAPARGHPQRAAVRRTRAWRTAFERRFRQWDIATDLAEDIGQGRWFRGLGAMLGLGVAALCFWPDFSALEAATTRPADKATRDEFRSQMILPLKLGGDSGRRMAATAAVEPLTVAPERPSVKFVATLAQGDSFGRMLQRSGVGAGDAERIASLVANVTPVGQIAPGTRFGVTLGARGEAGQPRPLDRLDFRARFDLNVSIRRSAGGFSVDRRPIAIDETPLRIRGVVGPSLYRSARAAGAPAKAIEEYLRVIDTHLNLEGDVALGDTFDIVASYKRSASGESEVGQVLYAGLERGGRPRAQLVRWGKDGQFFEASGMASTPRVTGLVSPVNGRMTSGYGLRRHPILGYARMHAGIDFGAAWGSPIFAVSDGVVAFAGRHGGHGIYVRLEHGGGLGTGYGHMSRLAVTSGSRVSAGQVIGYVGSTGLSTGPHLHYELYQNGRTVNPNSVRFAISSAVDKSEVDAFKARLARLKAVTPGAALQKLGSANAAAPQQPAGNRLAIAN